MCSATYVDAYTYSCDICVSTTLISDIRIYYNSRMVRAILKC